MALMIRDKRFQYTVFFVVVYYYRHSKCYEHQKQHSCIFFAFLGELFGCWNFSIKFAGLLDTAVSVLQFRLVRCIHLARFN